VLPEVPRLAESTDGLARAHRQLAHGLEAFNRVRWKAITASQEELSISKDASELIVQLVTQDFAEARGEILKRMEWQVRCQRSETNSPLNPGCGEGNKRPEAGNEIGGARRDEETELPVVFRRGHDDDRSCFHKQGHGWFKRIGRWQGGFVEQRNQGLSMGEDFTGLIR
jgi:hypothetical protein